MATADSIPAFPCDINREAFGHWLSGFVDGEGNFCIFKYSAKLRRGQNTPEINRKATFQIALRADDVAILLQIQSFFGCGKIDRSREKYLRGRMNHWARLSIRKIGDLANIVIPHFEKHPLRTKKARDFVIFKQGVGVMMEVRASGRRPITWSPGDDQRFQSLITALKQGHVYNSTNAPIPLPVLIAPDPFETLFDKCD